MSKIARVTQSIFAGSASNNGQFGSAQLGTKVLSNDLATLMNLSAYGQGWLDAVIGGSKFPPLEEFQALSYIETTQLAYLLQEGVAEWDSGTTYYKNSWVKGVGTDLLYSSIIDNNLNNAVTDTTSWRLISGSRNPLTTDTSYYITTTGNDSTGNGTVVAPWLTIQHAINYINSYIDLAGFTATINVADGTYTTPIVIAAPFTGGGKVVLQGDTGTPANCILNSTTNSAITVENTAVLYLAGGFKITTSGSSGYDGIYCTQGGQVIISGAMEYGAISGSALAVQHFGAIYVNSNYKISGNQLYHMFANLNGIIDIAPALTVTLTGTPAFGTDFAYCAESTVSAPALTYSGSATGTRYSVIENGVIRTNGGGASYFPGNASGASATGGQYV